MHTFSVGSANNKGQGVSRLGAPVGSGDLDGGLAGGGHAHRAAAGDRLPVDLQILDPVGHGHGRKGNGALKGPHLYLVVILIGHELVGERYPQR